MTEPTRDLEAWPEPGTRVTYHGSMAQHHGRPYVIVRSTLSPEVRRGYVLEALDAFSDFPRGRALVNVHRDSFTIEPEEVAP